MNELHSPDLSPEELAKRLDDTLASGKDVSLTSGQQDDPRIQIAVRLANTQHPQMSPQMLSRVQAKVVKANRQQVTRRQLQQRRVWRPKYTLTSRLAAAFTIITVFFTAAALPALASSVPGEFWYPFKRSLENVEISIASSSTSRAGVYLTQAERRIEEAQVLLQRQVFDAELLLDARNSLSSFEQLSPQLDTTLASAKLRAALATESVALLIQEAEQQQILSGNQVVALLPTLLPLPSNTLSPSLTPTIEPSVTPTPTSSPESVVVAPASATPTDTDMLAALTPTVEYTQEGDFVPTITKEPSLIPDITETSTPLPTATATSQPALAVMYAIENANVRSKPSRDQSVITVLQQGTSTEVIGEDDSGKWWRVKLQDDRLGWVAKFLLSVDKPTSAVGSNGSSGNNDSSGNNGNSDFGCEHSGNYCNAPGQIATPHGSSNGNPSPHAPSDNPPNGNPPSNPGNGHKS